MSKALKCFNECFAARVLHRGTLAIHTVVGLSEASFFGRSNKLLEHLVDELYSPPVKAHLASIQFLLMILLLDTLVPLQVLSG